ncbi:hypothetical protein AB1E18_010542 [Capra hircus]
MTSGICGPLVSGPHRTRSPRHPSGTIQLSGRIRGPCVFQIILRRVRELTQTATGQMLMVAAYSKLPSRDPEAP